MSMDEHHSDGPHNASADFWNLDRIYSREKGKFRTCAPGTKIDAYVVDSGINPDHDDFQVEIDGVNKSRVKPGWHHKNYSNTEDTYYHGTFVASVLGGKTCGIARNVNLIAVKVCTNKSDLYLTTADAAVKWITKQVQNNSILSVINMSFGGRVFRSFVNAVKAALNAGIVVVASAGNHNVSDLYDETDSCKIVPANITRAITVGATNKDDYLSAFSFLGPCVDIYAPGSHISGANYTLDPMYGVSQGTSFSAPLVAGVVAGMLQVFRDAKYYTKPSKDVVKDINKYIIKYAENGKVKGLPKGNNNFMLQATGLYTVDTPAS
ncbi:uncharacterized protein LOC106150807 [Lingula anatina]|uniref:Uncharacterized protein LOC106150807 n=1 Tax=Lingula anatina TaxID=7574 RepID=A0A1S3GZT0_LINAN|nr:uncharacterized protein LOC106150807 [Lingula anatina]|eukprot:XP_013379258.1 uncharacterized protein LOC106150807 [Lingula anatina]